MARDSKGGLLAASVAALILSGVVDAQVAKAVDDTPSVKVAGTLFTNYTYVIDPQTMVEDSQIHPNAFNVGRAYVNITGNLHHRLSFRVTQDIFSPSASDSSSVVGNYVFRLKYTFAQLNLDDWLPRGSWVRFGLQHTPYIDYAEGVYRYRFQGTIFPDRAGKLTSSDKGVSAKLVFRDNYGDVHVGVYNGEGYSKAEANDQKAFQGRLTVRPMPEGILHGIRLTGFIDADHYASGDAKTRWLANAVFEHPHLNAGFDFLGATDQTASTAAEVKSEGFSVWATPRVGNGWEGLLRYDQMKPDKDMDSKVKTSIAGVAYWFPLQKGVSGAILADYQQVEKPGPDERQLALHTLLNF